ncbi:MAG: hypothetical protein FWG82_02570 [Oscillospiraceae bacterium]|nr:hypothetical protein [Oscillospiraceae bacterium]
MTIIIGTLKTALIVFMSIVTGLFSSLGIFSGTAVEKKDCYPIVFVHGLGGWGEGAKLNNSLPHWGMAAGSMQRYLNSQGYETHAASVGPTSSAWDRACELYAHITGTRVDYGAAHAKAHDHQRFGETYDKALVPNLSAENKIHLIGHSFGGATIRMFTQFISEGSAAEIADGAADISPLFTGNLAGCVASITTLAAPHNGSAVLLPELEDNASSLLNDQLSKLAAWSVRLPIIGKYYPFRLEHFVAEGATSIDTQEVNNKFSSGMDRAEVDLSPDGAFAVNQQISCQQNIYYFSFVADLTEDDGNGNRVPKANMWEFFRDSGTRIGLKRDPITTANGVVVDASWQPNDGLVSVASAKYPFGEPNKVYDADNVEKGMWQVMPTITNWDHIDFAGGLQKVCGAEGIREFYLNLAQLLEKLD